MQHLDAVIHLFGSVCTSYVHTICCFYLYEIIAWISYPYLTNNLSRS